MKTGVLFKQDQHKPLADLIRPQTLEEIVGQKHILSNDTPFMRNLKQGVFVSTLFWGPPGCGKTTLSKLIAHDLKANYIEISAVKSGISDMRVIFEEIRNKNLLHAKTIVFIDEIHRFNRSQQDFLLPYVEDGSFVLIAATTENPSFELCPALLSRLRTLTLERLSEQDLDDVLKRVEKYFNRSLALTSEARQYLCQLADGDGRMVINYAELIAIHSDLDLIDVESIKVMISKRPFIYDKSGENHYNLISALHKSLRGSDVQAALYWFARMRLAGEDLLFIARRLIRFASEDIGLADPQALTQAIQAAQAYERLGSPEGDLCIAQAVAYLATAPKSNALYLAFKKSAQRAEDSGSLPPPKSILNAPTKFMESQGYGEGYIYDHDTPYGFSGQNYFPDSLSSSIFYSPKEVGFEREIKKRIDYWYNLKNKIRSSKL